MGPRPIDLHLAALKKLGVKITEDHGYLNCSCEDGLYGTEISLSFPSVGATQNVMLTACCAQGETILNNAAREPEIVDLQNFLNACGAKVSGAGESTIAIQGVPELSGCSYTVMPDRIVAATYLAAGAITGGNIVVHRALQQHLTAVLPAFEEMGCRIRVHGDSVSLWAPRRLKPLYLVRTMPYPGFPTDAQAPMMALAAVAKGTSVFVENIFESRYKHVEELARMGANIKVQGRVAVVEGVGTLHSAKVCSTDLRGGAALVLAGLAAQGTTQLTDLKHIDRGYDALEQSLSRLGAKITRE